MLAPITHKEATAMKKLIVMAMVLAFCLVGSAQAETWVLDPQALAIVNKMLLDSGHGNFIAQSGTTSADLVDRNSPTYNDLICTDTKTNGMVRVRVTRRAPGHKITEVKVLK